MPLLAEGTDQIDLANILRRKQNVNKNQEGIPAIFFAEPGWTALTGC